MRVRSELRRTLYALAPFLFLGCGLLTRAPRPVVLANSLQDVAPHGDRDHFVYLWERVDNGQVVAKGMQVEHVTAVGGGDFDILLSEDGAGMGRTRLRDTGDSLLLVREDDLSRGLRIAYDPPLLEVQAPLYAGEQRVTASATMSRLADGQVLGVFPVEQVVTVRRGPTVHSPIGTFAHSIVVEVVRTLAMPEQANELKSETVLVPGIGELRSTGTASETPQLRRELACAIIAGRRVGDCTNLMERRDQKRAGPADLR